MSPTSSLTTSQAGLSATFTVVLTAPPSSSVTIPLMSSVTEEGVLSSSSLTFTPYDWNVPQSIVVTGVDDHIDNGNVDYSVLIGPSVSDNPSYNDLNVTNLPFVNLGTDVAGIVVTPGSGLVTDRGGDSPASLSFSRLNHLRPSPSRSILRTSTQGTLDTQFLTFNPIDWSIPQTVTVTGVQDYENQGPVSYSILFGPASSLDLDYNGLTASPVSVTNLPIPNRPPIVVVPGLQSTPAYDSLVFTNSNGNAITLSDPDAGQNPVEVTLSASSGSLTLSSLTGLVTTPGSDQTSSFILRGTINDINAALNGLRFSPAPGETGFASLKISADNLGNSGSGGPQTDSGVVTIDVLNSAPSLSPSPVGFLNPVEESFGSGTNPGDMLNTVSGLKVSDPDPGSVAGVAVVGVDAGLGTWQYTTNGGASWIDLGPASNQQVTLLVINSNDRLRFLPSPFFVGTSWVATPSLGWNRRTVNR